MLITAAGAAPISRDGTIAFARVTWDKPATQVTTADAGKLIGAAESADGPDVHISLGGQSIETSERPSIGISVVVAVAAALVILLLVFGGALLSSLLPLATAGLALVTATSLIGLLSHAFDVASVSSELAILIGLGVGVDYGLFIISRHRSAVKGGPSYSDAAALAVRTSGRTVLLAGITVCIALLGQFALGVRFLYGPSLGAAIAVALTMTASLTFLPAMLGFLGPRVLSPSCCSPCSSACPWTTRCTWSAGSRRNGTTCTTPRTSNWAHWRAGPLAATTGRSPPARPRAARSSRPRPAS